MTDHEDDFREEVVRVMSSGPPSTGDDLLGMEIDFNAYLGDLDALDTTSVSVRRTPRPDLLISAECSAASGASIAEAAEAVGQAWREHLRYRFHEAHHLSLSNDEALFRFITQVGPARFYVTGQVTIRPASRSSGMVGPAGRDRIASSTVATAYPPA